MSDINIKAEKGTFKGKAVLTLTSGPDERYPFTFGLQKAKRILACLKDIEAFVVEQEAAPKAEVKVALK